MSRKQIPLAALWSGRFRESYSELSADRQASCDRAVLSLIEQRPSPGLRVKPLVPEKYYREARISSGDRIVFRIEGGSILFVDVVTHDDIERYGRRRHRPR